MTFDNIEKIAINGTEVGDLRIDGKKAYSQPISEVKFDAAAGGVSGPGGDAGAYRKVTLFKGETTDSIDMHRPAVSANARLSGESITSIVEFDDVDCYALSVAAGSFLGFERLRRVKAVSVDTVGDGAFRSSGLVSGDFPSLTAIGSAAFMDCARLESVVLTAQDRVTLGAAAFDGVPESCTVWVKNEAYRDWYAGSDEWSPFIRHVSSVMRPTLRFTLDGAVLKQQVLNYNMDGTPPPVSKRGYQLTGWAPSYLSVKSDTESEAQVSAITYSISYVLSGGSHPASDPASYTVESPEITFGAPTKTGYKNGAFRPASIPAGSVGDVTAVALYDPIAYYVAFDGNGAQSGSKAAMTCLYDVAYPDSLVNPYVRPGYSFANWKDQTGETRLSSDEIRNWTSADGAEFRLSAQWTADRYTIRYELGGGANSPRNPDSYTIESPDIVFEPATMDGYDFVKWTDGANQVTSIPHGSRGNVNVSAVWEPSRVSLTYDTGYDEIH